jgi:Ran GTPase-activating protein (RanGAP) involved in mRNA processing and transport
MPTRNSIQGSSLNTEVEDKVEVGVEVKINGHCEIENTNNWRDEYKKIFSHQGRVDGLNSGVSPDRLHAVPSR